MKHPLRALLICGLTVIGLFAQGAVPVPAAPVRKVTLGINISPGADDAEGVKVMSVNPASPASSAGLRAGDVIVKFGTATVASDSDLRAAIAGVRPGAAVPIGVLREGKAQTLTATFGSTPAAVAAPASPSLAVPPTTSPAAVPLDDGLAIARAALENAIKALEGQPTPAQIATARAEATKALDALRAARGVRSTPRPPGPIAPVAPGGAAPMDMNEVSTRVRELLDSGMAPREIEKTLADEFPGVNIKIQVGGNAHSEDAEDDDAAPAKPHKEQKTAPTSRPAESRPTQPPTPSSPAPPAAKPDDG